MWKLKFASKLAGGPSIPDIPGVKSTPKTNYRKYARWAGLTTSGAALGIVFGSYILGPIAAVECLLVFILEFPVAIGSSLRKLLNFFNDYKWRAVFFGVAAIPIFFSLDTIIGAIADVATGGFYGYCWFKGEKGDELKPKAATSNDAESNNKKKSGLATKGAAPGVV